jgi:hypothetical protein
MIAPSSWGQLFLYPREARSSLTFTPPAGKEHICDESTAMEIRLQENMLPLFEAGLDDQDAVERAATKN